MESGQYDQAIVTSYFTECSSLIHSEILPGTSQEVFKLPENAPPASFQSLDGQTYATPYFEFPLYPIQGDVCDFSRSYLYLNYTNGFGLCVGGNTYSDTYITVGTKYANGTASRAGIGMDSNYVYDDAYNFLHSSILSASVCASEAEHSPEYSTIDGLLRNKVSPMKIVCIPANNNLTWDNANDTTKAYNLYTYKVNYSYSIDLNRLSILTSNMQFTTVFDGNIRLRYWLVDMLKNFHYMVLPSKTALTLSAGVNSGTGKSDDPSKTSTLLGVQGANGILTINPIRWHTAISSLPNVATGGNKCAVDFGTEYTEWIPIAAPIVQTITTKYTNDSTATNSTATNTFSSKVANPTDGSDIIATVTKDNTATDADFQNGFISIPIMFTFNKPTNTNYVLQMERAYIYQYVSRLRSSAMERLHSIFSDMKVIVRPTQQFVSSVFVNSAIGPTTTMSPMTELQAVLNASNITHVIITNIINENLGNACLMNFFRKNYQVLLNGNPINNIVYDKVDGRVIKDYTNAIYDTDNEEINNDYLYSLQFPGYMARTGGVGPDLSDYFSPGDFKAMKTINWNSATPTYFKQPNVFFDVFSTSAPSSFMTGICIAPQSAATLQVTLRGNYQDTLYQMADATEKRYITTPMWNSTTGTATVASSSNLTLPSYVDRNCNTWVSAIADCVFALEYDSDRRRAVGVSLSTVYPFKDGDGSR